MILRTLGDPSKSPFNEWLTQNALYVAIGCAAALVIIVTVVIILSKKKRG